MAIIIIAKNNTGTDIEIEDLGISISAAGQKELANYFDYIEIVESDNLKNFVSNAHITINDGNNDLNISDGLKHISIQSVYEDSFEDGGTGSTPLFDLPVSQISQQTQFNLNNTYADILWDTIILENDTDIIEWDQTNRERIHIKEEGLYTVKFNTILRITDQSFSHTYFRMRRNNNIVIGQEIHLYTYNNEIQQLTDSYDCNCNINDFITLQGHGEAGRTNTILYAWISVKKQSGIKGDSGSPGGTTVNVEKDDLNIVSNCDVINFEGSVSVVDNGSNKTTVTIIDNKYEPKAIQIYDDIGNYNLNDATPFAYPFNKEDIKDIDVFDHSIIVNNTRSIVLLSGWYNVSFKISYDNGSNRRNVKSYIQLNGTDILDRTMTGSYVRNSNDEYGCNTLPNTLIYLTANDYIELLNVREGSSGSVTSKANQCWCKLELFRAGEQ